MTRNTKKYFSLILISLMLLLNCTPIFAANDSSDNYTWDNLKLGNYCWMSGMVIHPKDSSLIYVRTDVGGLYRYNPQSTGENGLPQACWDIKDHQWTQLLDGYNKAGKYVYGVHAVAVDPNDTNVVYAAYGYQGQEDLYGKTDIIKSTDKGNTWSRMRISEKAGYSTTNNIIYCGNDSISRTSPESLIVDPENSKVIYFGTQNDGLWRTLDGGQSWEQIASVPTDDPTASGDSSWRIATNSGGVEQVYLPDDNQIVDTNGVTRSKNIYLSVWGHGVYKSTDGGDTFELIPNSPIAPYQIQLVKGSTEANDKLYVSSQKRTYRATGVTVDGGFWVYKNGSWTDLSKRFNYHGNNNPKAFGAFMIDSRDSSKIYVTSAPWTNYTYMWKTLVGELFWTDPVQINQGSVMLQDPANLNNVWYPGAAHLGYIKDISSYSQTNDWEPIQDYNYGTVALSSTGDPMPVNPGRYIYADNGIEGLVCGKIVSVPTAVGVDASPLVLINMMDHGLRVQEEYNRLELVSKPKVTTGGGIDFCEEHPNYVFRTGTSGNIDGLEYGMAGYSENYGRINSAGSNFTEVNWNDDLRIVDCAVGAEFISDKNYPVLMVVSPGHHGADNSGVAKGYGEGVYRSLDGGQSWQIMSAVAPLSSNRTQDLCNNRYIASDRVNPSTFYYLGGDQKLYITRDNGDTWYAVECGVNGAPSAFGTNMIKAIPGVEGGLWVKGSDGFVYATYNFGSSWEKISANSIVAFGFGKGNGFSNNPAVYILGVVDGVRAIYISNDLGNTWTRISPEEESFSIDVVDIAGDRNTYGRVFVATGGRGTLYGDGVPENEDLGYVAGDTLSLVATVNNTYPTAQDFVMVAAFYSTSDRLLGVQIGNAEAPGNCAQAEIEFEITVPDYGERTKMKAFVWESMSGVKPLFEAVTAYESRY